MVDTTLGTLEGTAELRLDFHEIACERLAAEGVATAFVRRESRLTYVARWLPGPPFEVSRRLCPLTRRSSGSTTAPRPAAGHRRTPGWAGRSPGCDHGGG